MNGVVSTQVLQELYVSLRRQSRSPLPASEAERILRDYFEWEVFVNTRDSILRAIAMEAKYKISFWDGLIVQAAEATGATTLYSEDLNDGQLYGLVTITNPFRI